MTRLALLIVLALTVTVPSHAQVTCTTIADNSQGTLRFCGNELLVISKIDDPSAIRLRAPSTQGGMGKISFDSGTTEKVLLIGAQSPGGGGEFSVNFLRPGGASIDSDMVKVLWGNHEQGFNFTLPVINGGGGWVSGGSDHLQSIDGRWRLYAQADGNVAHYEQVAAVWCPRWSTWTGNIPKSSWPTTGPTAACRQ